MQKTSRIMIDFDKTISPTYGFNIAPDTNVIECIKRLHEKYIITIYSCRSNLEICDETEHLEMIRYLEKYNIPYDEINRGKPLYVALIDDRSFNPVHTNWLDITNFLINKII